MRNIIALIFVLCCSSELFAQADIILHHGKIFTADKQKPWAEAVAIHHKVIVAVGSSDDIMKWKTDSTRIIDLKGKTLIPGFNDAHCHIGPQNASYNVSMGKDMLTHTPWPLVKDSVVSIVSRLPKGRWITIEVNAELFEDLSVRRKRLDSIAPNHQVVLQANTGHGVIMNSRALQLLRINENTRFLAGDLEKDKDGKLTGLCWEYAGFGVGQQINKTLSYEQIVDELKGKYAGLASLGLTSVQNMAGSLMAADHMKVYMKQAYPVRVRLIPFLLTNEADILYEDWMPLFDMIGGNNSIRGMKIILDGTPVERLAAVRKPYADMPDYYGHINFSTAQLKKFLQTGIDYRQQIMVHAVGDSAIQFLFNTMLSMQPAAFWAKRRVRLEHGDMLAPDQYKTAKDLGIILVVNPLHFGLPPVMNTRYGGDRMKYLQATKSILDYGIPVAIGSDGPPDPYLNILLSLINPDNPAEALNIEQTVMAYTMGSAYAEFMENRKGSISPGKYADMVVISDDIFTLPPNEMMKAHTIMTIMDGQIIFDAKQLN